MAIQLSEYMKLGKLFEAVVGVITLPIEIVKDVVTLGAEKAMEDEFYTERKVKKIARELDEVTE